MLTTGIDLIAINRIGKSLANPRFLTRVFSVAEIDMFERRGYPVQTIAANFAAKALGTGIRGFRWNEVSVLRDSFGKPYFLLEGRAKYLAEQAGLCFSLSLSHTDDTAAAFVVGYSD